MSLESAQVEEEYENVVRTIVHNHVYRVLHGSASVTVGLGPFVSILDASPYQLGCFAADLHIPCRRDQAAVEEFLGVERRVGLIENTARRHKRGGC